MFEKSRSLPIVAALALAFAVAPAFAESVIVDAGAGNWNKKKESLIKATGATIVWKHQPTGLALIRSASDGLYAKILATGAFQKAARDVRLNWLPGLEVSGHKLVRGQGPIAESHVVDPSNDGFYFLQWPHTAIHSEDAWHDGECDGAGARVAIIDGGINNSHIDLNGAGHVDAACSVNFSGSGSWNTDTGTFWHGTFVAGVVGAEDDAVGIVGVAPRATLLGVKVLHGGSGNFNAILAGILYAANPALFGAPGCARADIMNISLGVSGGVLRRSAASHGEGQNFLAFITKVFNYASNQGVLHVGSAGNAALDFGQFPNAAVVPNQLSNGVVVSATAPIGWLTGDEAFDTPTSYTNFGEDLVWVSAPGGDFNCFTAECDEEDPFGFGLPNWVFDGYFGLLSPGNDGYTWSAGTSFSSPTAAGVAALMKGANPALTRANLKALLKNTAYDSGKVGKDEFHGHGFVDAAAACAAAQ